MRKLVLMLALTTLALALPGGAAASPGDPVHANDVIGLAGWKEKTWAHFGNWRRGEVSAETWVDLHWPCFTATDEDQDVSSRTCAAMVWSASSPRSSARRSTSSASAATPPVS